MSKEKMAPEVLETYITELVARSKTAQKEFESNYLTNRAVDEVLRAIGKATCENAEELCQDALAETGMGNLESKIGKLVSAAKIQWVMCKGKNTIDYEDSPGEPGVKYLPKPVGVVGAVMPSTNPVATIIGNAMMALKGRNSIIIAPHPASVHTSDKMVNILRTALKEVGAPEDLIQGISAEAASIEATTSLMSKTDINLATGGAGMVKAVYSSGKPGIGVGQGNCQDIIDNDRTEDDLEAIVAGAIYARTMDNGVPCVGTQMMHVPAELEKAFLEEAKRQGAFVTTPEQTDILRELVFPGGLPRINRDVVGKLPYQVGKLAGIDIPEGTTVIVSNIQAWGDQDILCREILFPFMRYTTYEKFEDAVDHAVANLETEGAGHSSSIQSNNDEHIQYAAKRIPVGRFHINQPTCGGANGLDLTITVGCGTWGGTSVSENVCYYHLLNKTKVTTILEHPNNLMEASWDDFEPFSKVRIAD